MSPAQYVDQRGVQIPTADELARRDAANKLIYDGKRAEEARMVAAHRAREADKAAREAEEQERADADLAARLAPWQKEHAKIESQRDKALAQSSACLKKVESDPLSLRYTSDALAAQAILESYESQLALSESRKPS